MTAQPDWHARFDAYAAKKTREAVAAELFPFVTVDERADVWLRRIGNAWTRRLFGGPFYVARPRDVGRPSCSLVFVESADGNTGADDPGSLGGGLTDKHVVYEGLSRVAADAVMTGAGTLRGGDVVFSVWHPEIIALRASLGLPRHPIQMVVTNRGLDLDHELIFNVPSVRVVLLAPTAAARPMEDAIRARPWIDRVQIPADGDLRGAFERLREIGIATLSCVGGRTLAQHLLAADLVDDVYLTTAPVAGGEPDTPLAPWPWRGPVVLRKHGTGPESGVVFEQIVPVREC